MADPRVAARRASKASARAAKQARLASGVPVRNSSPGRGGVVLPPGFGDGVEWNMKCDKILDTGKQCRRNAIAGGEQCAAHATVKKAISAAKRLAELKEHMATIVAPAAVDQLHDVILAGEDAIATRASLGVLDRVGLGPTQAITMEMNVNVESPMSLLMSRFEAMTGHGLAGLPPAGSDDGDDDVVDAELVDS